MAIEKFAPVKTFPTRDLDQLIPRVKAKALALIEACKKAKLDITITQTYRSSAYQQELYNKGRSTKGDIVTNCKPGQSPHEFRVAFDFCMSAPGHTWDVQMMDKVGAIGERLGLTWGGHFKSIIDKPHFQYNGGLTDQQIRMGNIPK